VSSSPEDGRAIGEIFPRLGEVDSTDALLALMRR
jgi:hypothetical protein